MSSIRLLFEAVRLGLVRETERLPCEWEPLEGRPARLGDDFHGYAEVTRGRISKLDAAKDRQLRVCRACSEEPDCILYCLPNRAVQPTHPPKEIQP